MAEAPLLATLRAARRARGITLAKASSLCGLNLSQISQIENARVDARLSSIAALAGMLGLQLALVPAEVNPTGSTVATFSLDAGGLDEPLPTADR